MKKQLLMRVLVLVVLITPIQAVYADGLARLMQFYQHTHAMTANFHQVVTDSQGRKLQEVDGTMMIQRPNRFRWDYQKPFAQEIVSDGKHVYLYDVDLEQVTVNPVAETLGASPAALLSGDDDLQKNFNLVSVEKGDAFEWVKVTPKKNDTGFNQIELAFDTIGALQIMNLVDSFGQQTAINFSQQNNAAVISPSKFKFIAPAGVDVLGQ